MPSIRHVEFAGQDGEALQRFYTELFGWPMAKRSPGGHDYFDFAAGDRVSGGIRHEADGPGETIVYVDFDDLDEALSRAVALGASVRIPPLARDGGRFALVVDPAGNTIGLLEDEPSAS